MPRTSVDFTGLAGSSVGKSILVNVPPLRMKPWIPLLSVYDPTISPPALMPDADVDNAPGTSIVSKSNETPSLARECDCSRNMHPAITRNRVDDDDLLGLGTAASFASGRSGEPPRFAH